MIPAALKRCIASASFVSLLAVLPGCGVDEAPVEVDSREVAAMGLTSCMPEVSCSGAPAVGSKQPWRHSIKSPLVTLAGSPQHRGIDLIAAADAPQQIIRGEVKYGTIDKSLEDEDVEVFACQAGAWQRLGVARTDGEGTFTLALSGSSRLPIGQRSLYVSVLGDRSSLAMLALVTPVGGQAVVSDVDGTLTSSENAFPESLITGATVGAQDGAAQALSALNGQCYHPIYVTARGRVFTSATRSWLATNGFPTGPLRLAPTLITLPGDPTVAYKAGVLSEIHSSAVGTAVGIGNRGSDAQAYVQSLVGSIYLKRPEFNSEIDPSINAGQATGIGSYRDFISVFAAFPRAP